MKRGQLLPNAVWTLGTCIKKCKGVIEAEVIDFAQQMLESRNSRAHALVEHSDPQLSIIGGDESGVEMLSSGHALIEPYRGDAKKVIEMTFKILRCLYGKQ